MPTIAGDHDPRPNLASICTPYHDIHPELLRLIDAHPTWTQRQQAKALDVSLGKTNYCVRALKEKGFVKWGNFTKNPNKLGYLHILTPEPPNSCSARRSSTTSYEPKSPPFAKN